MFIWPSILCYCGFSLFAYYNQRWARDFRGASATIGLAISVMGFIALLVGIVYLGYYGWTVSWIGAIAAFILSVAATIFGVVLERLIGTMAVQAASPVLWPLFAVGMFWLLR